MTSEAPSEPRGRLRPSPSLARARCPSEAKSIDELISILESRRAGLDERAELALDILKQRDGILNAPRYPPKHVRDAVDPVNKATARPLGRPKQRKATA